MNTGLIAEMASSRRRTPLLYADGYKPLISDVCARQIERCVSALRSRGVAPEDRVAVVLPNGPQLAMSFLAVPAAAAFAPLNPHYSRSEFLLLLRDLDAKVLVTQAGFCSAACAAAEVLDIPVLNLHSDPGDHAAGEFLLEGPSAGSPVPARHRVTAQSTALLLHSSGTTARPKLIPLTHANLCASAMNIARTLALDEGDVCLNVMPLFHIHGLIGALLSSIAAGGAVFCTTGFDAFRFHRSTREARATWCTAVPTMYQAVLARTKQADAPNGHKIRMLRSSSAPLHSRLWERLEVVFDCPVLNSYGMTEASHQIASNPLPPRDRKIGTVGLPTGPQLAIIEENGAFATPGECGEIVIRGETVTSGYLSPAGANIEAFRNGWLRTGDEGRFDQNGYLMLTGRLKEIINVGGEKVSPAEIDEVLMQHPAVEQALAFPVPSRAMGERIYAAVVPQSDSSEADLRRFAADHLARFKVPEKILILDSLPKGPTGKLQRIGMAERLGLSASAK